MWPFGSSDGCSGHHLKITGDTGKYEVYGTRGPYIARREVRKVCEHDDCGHTETGWRAISVVTDRSKEFTPYQMPPSRYEDRGRVQDFKYKRDAKKALADYLGGEVDL